MEGGARADAAGGFDVVVFSYSAEGFAAVHGACPVAGRRPVAYVYARAFRPGRPSGSHASETAAAIVETLPAGVDLLLPGMAGNLRHPLIGYRTDVLVCTEEFDNGSIIAQRGAVTVEDEVVPEELRTSSNCRAWGTSMPAKAAAAPTANSGPG